METIAVCLYSKYSQRCKEFLDDIREDMGIQMLCIDNKDVRDTIQKDYNGYHIKTVPCIFLFFPNGRLEKYEGSDAFVWLRKVKNKLVFVSTNTNNPNTSYEEEDNYDDDDNDEPEQLQLPQPPPSRSSISQQPIGALDITPIEENGINENEPMDTEKMIDNELSMRRASDQIITRKQDNIKDIAQQMQRQRESEEELMNPPPPGFNNNSRI